MFVKENITMNNDETEKAILNGIANGMDQEANNIEKDEQKIRDSLQPSGRILSEKEQERLATTTATLRESVRYLREKASWLKKNAISDTI